MARQLHVAAGVQLGGLMLEAEHSSDTHEPDEGDGGEDLEERHGHIVPEW